MLPTGHDPRVRLLTKHLGEPIAGGSQEIRFCSPFTSHFRNPNKSDREFHLYVNLRKGKFFDFRSELCGSVSYLYYLLGEAYDSEPISVPPLDELRSRFENLDRIQTFVLPIADLPEWYTPVHAGSWAYFYLLGRGLTDGDIAAYRIGEGYDDDGEYKVVIPSFGQSGECEYWVARTVNQFSKRRYTNPVVNRRYHLGFLHTAIRCSPRSVVLCEGVFSALIAGRDAVASYGKFVTNDQLHRLWRVGVRDLRIALDGDAEREAMETALRAGRMGFTTSIIKMPKDKDPADLGRQQFRTLLEQFQPVDEIGLMKMRLASLQ